MNAVSDICAFVLSSDVILPKSDKSLALLTQLEKMYKNGESKVNIQSNIISYLPLEEWAFFYSDTIDFLTYGGIVIYLFFLKI